MASETEIHGRDGHSSATHRGVNAVSHAARVHRLPRWHRRAPPARRPVRRRLRPALHHAQCRRDAAAAPRSTSSPRECTHRAGNSARFPAATPAGDDRRSVDALSRADRCRRACAARAPEADVARCRPIAWCRRWCRDADSPADALARRLTGANERSALCPSPPRPASSRRPASRPSSAGRAPSSRPTSPTNSSSSTSSRPARLLRR